MTPSELITLVKILALPMWILMALLPEWKVTRYLIDKNSIPSLMFFIYLIFLLLLLRVEGVFGFGSLGSAIELVTFENGIIGAIVLAKIINLHIGMWVLNKNRVSKLPHLLIIPCIVAAYFVGPLGFLLFVIIRRMSKTRWLAS